MQLASDDAELRGQPTNFSGGSAGNRRHRLPEL